MKYEKAISKLEKFTELSKEKQVKLLKKILTDRNVKFMSKYDIGTLRKMCKESEN